MVTVNDLMRGGAQRIILDMVQGISSEKVSFHVVYHKPVALYKDHNVPWLIEEIKALGIPVTCLNGNQKFSFGELWALVKLIRKEKPDIVQSFLSYACVVARFARCFTKFKLISVQCNVPKTYKKFKGRFLDLVTLPIATMWTAASEGIEIAYAKEINYFSKNLWQKGKRHFTIVAGVDLEKITRIGRELDREKKRESIGIAKEETMVLMTARLISWKGQEDLIRAASFLPPSIKIVLVGWGPMHDDLVALSKKLGVEERIIFLGARSDHYELLFTSDIFAQTCFKQEDGALWMGPNTAQIEACAAGIPSVSTNVPLIELLIKDKETGVLANMHDPKSIADAILWIIKNPDKAIECTKRAQEIIRAKYSIEAMNDAYVGVYQALLGR